MNQYVQEIEETTKVRLHGHIDASVAPALLEEMKTLVGKDIKRLVLLAGELEYIASAGLRAIVYVKQKLGADVEVYLCGASEEVLDVFKMTGLDRFLIIQDAYEG